VALVQFNQAPTAEEKLVFQRQMYAVKGFLKFKPIEWAQYHYFSNWMIVVLREMIGLEQFNPNSKVIAEQLSGTDITPTQVDQALKLLVDLRLVDRSLENKYFQKDTNLQLPEGMSQSFVFAFHKAMLDRAHWALMNLKSSDREFSANTFTFDSSQMKAAKDFLESMLSEFISRFGNQPNADSVFQLNYQFFEQATLNKKS
jgi:uncharacterized protein (TIGR02147 family)